MPVDLPLRCACGALRGSFAATPHPGARGVCYCDDCQAYARWLARSDVLNEFGGTEVIQTWPACVRLLEGTERLRLVRLSSKGLFRWYADCCHTPLANSFGSARFPFCGVMRRSLDLTDSDLDALYGPAHHFQGRFAPGGIPPGAAASATPTILARAAMILARGWWADGHAPTPFFDADGRPVAEAKVLSATERDSLV